MKKIFAFALVLALMLSINVVAFAAPSPTADTTPVEPAGGYTVKAGGKDLSIPANAVLKIGFAGINSLSAADAKAFMEAYEAVKAEGKVIRYFFWMAIPGKYLPEDFTYLEYNFTCPGENVQVTVNGKPMEVVHNEGESYTAHLTEFGAVAITHD